MGLTMARATATALKMYRGEEDGNLEMTATAALQCACAGRTGNIF